MTDKRDERVLALDHLEVNVDTVVMKDALYNIDYIKLDGCTVSTEMYDESDNWSNMLVAISDSAVVDSAEVEVEIDYSNPSSFWVFI